MTMVRALSLPSLDDIRSNAVVHMLSCNAVARAVRSYVIADAALNALMLTNEASQWGNNHSHE